MPRIDRLRAAAALALGLALLTPGCIGPGLEPPGRQQPTGGPRVPGGQDSSSEDAGAKPPVGASGSGGTAGFSAGGSPAEPGVRDAGSERDEDAGFDPEEPPSGGG